jgi:uncharacterized membrane protein YdjX (TVP38/TMEM64 family)
LYLAFGGYLVSQGADQLLRRGGVRYDRRRQSPRFLCTGSAATAAGRCWRSTGSTFSSPKKHIDHSEEWFQKYGTGVIFTARFIPVVRHAISVPAGITRMPLGKFTFADHAGCYSLECFVCLSGHDTLGDNWETIDEVAAKYTHEIILGALAVIVLYFLYLSGTNPRRREVVQREAERSFINLVRV